MKNFVKWTLIFIYFFTVLPMNMYNIISILLSYNLLLIEINLQNTTFSYKKNGVFHNTMEFYCWFFSIILHPTNTSM